MNNSGKLLVNILREPESILAYDPAELDLLIRQAVSAELLPRLWYLLNEHDLLKHLPIQVQRHLESSWVYSNAHERAVRWEVECLRQAFADLEIPVLLLKGGAYVISKLTASYGRIFNDIDILVPKEKLIEVEKALFRVGWRMTHLDEYDQKYYRKWMHEIPPMQHYKRKTVLDVHHTILPPTARLHPDPVKLLHNAQAVDGNDKVKTLCPEDMVLHSATHLFHDGELERGVRDLVDLDSLMKDFGKDQNFWDNLTVRAKELELVRPLYYALRYTTKVLATPVPDEVLLAANSGKPFFLVRLLMDALFSRALTPDHPSCDSRFTGLARWLLYVRSHYLRMPLHLLIPHLIRKACHQKEAIKQ